MIESILVPLDGSKAADKALDFALDLAQKYSADMKLLSVVSPVPVPAPAYADAGVEPLAPVIIEQYLKETRETYDSMLEQALEKAQKKNPGLQISTRLVEGRPAERIIEAAKEGSFDLVVMGSRGIGGIKQFFLGSVSHRVADEAPCPVLIVK